MSAIGQIYHAAILAKWYREQVQNTLLETAYVGCNRVAGVTADEKNLKEEIYERYIAAFRKGVFDYVKEEVDINSGEILPRKYFSGGETLFIERLDFARSADKALLSGSGFSVSVQARTIDAAQFPSLEQTHKLRDAVAHRFSALDAKAEFLFSDSSKKEELSSMIGRNTGHQQSLFHHIQVSTDNRIRNVYQEVQSLVGRVLGNDGHVFPVNLDEIHVTVSGEQIGPEEKFIITLNELAVLVQEDVQQGRVLPFSIRLLGPRLMPNGVVIMEYTTSAPEFFYLRQRSGQRINERKARLSVDVRGFEQNIIHSTVAVIRDPLIGQDKLRELKKSIDAYRLGFVPIDFRVEQITVTSFLEEERKFIKSVVLDLQVISGRQNGENMATPAPGDVSAARWRSVSDALTNSGVTKETPHKKGSPALLIALDPESKAGSSYGGIDLRDGENRVQQDLSVLKHTFRFDPGVMRMIAQGGGLRPVVTAIVPLDKTVKIFY